MRKKKLFGLLTLSLILEFFSLLTVYSISIFSMVLLVYGLGYFIEKSKVKNRNILFSTIAILFFINIVTLKYDTIFILRFILHNIICFVVFFSISFQTKQKKYLPYIILHLLRGVLLSVIYYMELTEQGYESMVEVGILAIIAYLGLFISYIHNFVYYEKLFQKKNT